jgi:hypothetical protein
MTDASGIDRVPPGNGVKEAREVAAIVWGA